MNMMNVRVLYEKQPIIDMGPVRIPVRIPVRSRNSPPKGSQSKSIQHSKGTLPNVSQSKGSLQTSKGTPSNVSQSKGSLQTSKGTPSNVSQPKGSSPKGVANKNPYNNSMLPVRQSRTLRFLPRY